MLVLFLIAGSLNAGRAQTGQLYPGQLLVGFVMIFLWAADLAAAGLGLASLFQSGRKNIFGLLGLVYSSLTLISSIGLVVLGLLYVSRLAR